MPQVARHSAAFDALDDAGFAGYRAVALDRKARLADMVRFAGGHGVKISASQAMRDRAWFAAVEERKARFREAGRAAEQLVAQVSEGGVAALQSGAANLLTQLVFDYLANLGAADDENVGRLTALGHALSNLTRSQIDQRLAEIKVKASQAAEKVSAIGKAKELDESAVADIRKAVFGIVE